MGGDTERSAGPTGEVITMGAAIRAAGREEPDRALVLMGDRTMTWGELDHDSDRLAHMLVSQGVVPGDAVSMILPNGFPFLVTAAAIWKLGATPHLLSPRMAPSELAELLELAKPGAVVTTLDVAASAPVIDPTALGEETALADAHGDVPSHRWIAFASGGSTGRPKIVIAEQLGVVGPGTDIDHLSRGYSLDRETVIVLPGPLCHAGPFGLATYTFFNRGRIVLLDRFDAEETLRVVERHRATTIFLVPTMMNRIMQLAPEVRDAHDVSSLHTVWHSAAPCPPWLKDAWIDWLGPEVIEESYGASDSAGMTRINGVQWLEHRGSVGLPAFGEVAIFGEDGAPVPTGTVGDIYMRAPPGALLRTYIGAAAPQNEDGWSTVGDMGWLDEEGYLYLADRRVDLIISGGLNVYPAEVEGVLEAHPMVSSSAVVGVPDDDLGKRVHAVVHAVGPVSVEELQAFAREQLSPYKVPRTIELVDTPVRDDSGKVRRRAIADRVAAAAAGTTP